MKELGQLLKERRKSMDISFVDIYRITKIQEKYIAAIENGDMKTFSAEVYYKSFVRSYAAYLGLDPEELLKQYEARKRNFIAKKMNSKNKNSKKNSGTFLILGLAKKETLKKMKLVVKPLTGILITSIITTTLSLYFNKYLKNKSSTAKATIVKLKPENEKTEDVNVIKMQHTFLPVATEVNHQSDDKKNADTTKKSVAGDKQKLSVEATSEVWLRVDADNKNIFEETIVAGTRKSWESNATFVLKIGYVPGIKIFFNENPVDATLGAVQDVNTITLKKK